MKLTVVIPYYNRRELLLNVLRSFVTEHPIDTIIVDEGFLINYGCWQGWKIRFGI